MFQMASRDLRAAARRSVAPNDSCPPMVSDIQRKAHAGCLKAASESPKRGVVPLVSLPLTLKAPSNSRYAQMDMVRTRDKGRTLSKGEHMRLPHWTWKTLRLTRAIS